MNDCIIGIGSNIDADTHIPEMLRLLANDIEIIQVSQMIQTKPIGITEQADYTNGAVRIKNSKIEWDATEVKRNLVPETSI